MRWRRVPQGPVVNRLSHTSFAVGKRVRAETQLMTGAVSVSYAAVELAAKIFDSLETKSIVLLGAGETAELTLKILAERERATYNRQPVRACTLKS